MVGNVGNMHGKVGEIWTCRVVSEICKQTNKQTDRLMATSRTPTGDEVIILDVVQSFLIKLCQTDRLCYALYGITHQYKVCFYRARLSLELL